MADITITIPGGILSRIIDAIAYQNGYSDTIPDPDNLDGPPIPNPVSKSSYSLTVLRQWVRENVKAYEAVLAANSARDTAENNADSATDSITVV